jgi:hypothetical protein
VKLNARHAPCLWLIAHLALWTGAGSSSPAADTGVAARSGEADFFDPAVLTGTIYAKGGNPGAILFTFRRTASRDGSTVRVLREFSRPDGTVVSREKVLYDAGKLVSCQTEEPLIGTRGSIIVQSNPKDPRERRVDFEYISEPGGGKRTGNEKLEKDMLVNDMVAPFLAVHWNELKNGLTVRCRLVALTRAETVGFKFFKDSETLWRGKPAILVTMQPTSWIIARLVDPIVFTVEAGGQHRILQYVGRVTPRIPKGNKWADVDGVSVYDWN